MPLNIIALSTLPRHILTQGTAIRSLMRNLGGSIGISVLVATLAQNTQVVHSRLVEGLRPDNPLAQAPYLAAPFSLSTPSGMAALNAEVTRQAAMVAYIDDFKLMMLIALASAAAAAAVARGAPPCRCHARLRPQPPPRPTVNTIRAASDLRLDYAACGLSSREHCGIHDFVAEGSAGKSRSGGMTMMPFRLSRRALLGAAPLLAIPLGGGTAAAAGSDFQGFLAGVQRDASAQGVRPATIQAAFRYIQFLPRVVELDRKQPERK